MNFERQFEEAPDISEACPENTLETCRVLVVKVYPSGSQQILLCTNQTYLGDRTGKDQNKGGMAELPGGKVYETREQHRAFLELDKEGRDKQRLQIALGELEQETGLFINPNRLKPLSATLKPLQGLYPAVPEAEFIKTQFYIAVLGHEEYADIPQNYTAALVNDDQHSIVNWEDYAVENLSDESLQDYLAKNSQIPQEILEQAAEVITEHQAWIRERVATVLTNPGISFSAGDIAPRAYASKKSTQQQAGSIIDINRSFLNLLKDQDTFNQAYEAHFGRPLDQAEIYNKVLAVLHTYCVNDIIRRGTESPSFGETEMEKSEPIRDLINRIQTPEDLFRLFRMANNSVFGRRMIKTFLGFGKISSVDYFPYIQSQVGKFEAALRNLTEQSTRKNNDGNLYDERLYLKGFAKGARHFIEIDSGQKTAQRMAQKSTTKPEIDPTKIKDVYRARVIVENDKAVNDVINKFLRNLGGLRSSRANGWLLHRDDDTTTNPNADQNRREWKLIGSYPVLNKGGQVLVRIPVEIQIMTKTDYDQNETGANHHDVYMAIQNLVEEARPTTPISDETLEGVIERLKHTPDVYKSYPDYVEGRSDNSAFIKRLDADIRQRIAHYFFQDGTNGYYSFHHVSRLRNASDLTRHEDQLFRSMGEHLNKKLGICLHAQDWYTLFESSDQLDPEIIATRIGVRVFELKALLAPFKVDLTFDDEAICQKFMMWLDLNVLTMDQTAWIQYLSLSERPARPDRRFKRIIDTLAQSHDFQRVNGWEVVLK